MSHLLIDNFSKRHHSNVESFLFAQNHQLLHVMLYDFARDHPHEKSRDVCCIKCSKKIKMIGTDYQNSSRKSCHACSYSEFLLKQNSAFLLCLKLTQNSQCATLVCARNQKSCCWDICNTYCHV